ncbi:MAG: pyrimidine-nucleoside phosphorylase [Bacteroidetes bacterium]|nr:pyrimidine-nucleoside phosphorylase [Bacteroidota bacterium]
MRIYDIILKKRNGEELAKEEIDFVISGYVKGDIPDYQMSALLMAIYFQGLNKRETIDLTTAMINSGEVIDLSKIKGIKVDKHSTGGVGDKTSIVLGPMVAACGVPVAKLSGRGLGHTGGTIDKLESFSGFSMEMTENQFVRNVNDIGIAIGAQTANLVPADKMLYALRDVTATVDNISLIASSIMSKKLASGADAIVLDVKTGDGAFIKDTDSAFELAKRLVGIGTGMGKQTVAIVSDMEQPLGNAIGNAIEVKEAIDTLKGNGPKDLIELCLKLGSQMLMLAGLAKNDKDAAAKLKEAIDSGKALEKLKQFVKAQGGDPRQVDDPRLLPAANCELDVVSEKHGYIEKIHAETIGRSSLILGAGRETKESEIDLTAGIYLHKKVGDYVKKDEKLATLYTNNKNKLQPAKEKLLTAYHFINSKVVTRPLILGEVSDNGVVHYK